MKPDTVSANLNAINDSGVTFAQLIANLSSQQLEKFEKEYPAINKAIEEVLESPYQLQMACRHGFIGAVKLLIARGVNVDRYHGWAIREASENGHADIVQLLVDAGANIHAADDDAMQIAVDKGYADVLNVLLAADAAEKTGKPSKGEHSLAVVLMFAILFALSVIIWNLL